MRKKGRILPIFLVIFVLCFSIYFFDKKGLLNRLKNEVERPIVSLRGFLHGAVLLKNGLSPQMAAEGVIKQAENTRLHEEIAVLENENRLLKKQLGSPLPAEFQFIAATILGLEKEAGRSRLLLAAGANQGVISGQAVVLENIFLGEVIRVTPQMAEVRLVDDSESKVAVKTVAARGILVKQKDGLRLERVLQSDDFEKDQVIKTSGEDGLPEGLLVGKVVRVFPEEKEPFKSGLVETYLDPQQLAEVFIIKI